MQIYIAQNGSQKGPFTELQTREMVAAGSLSLDDLAWTEGAVDWQPLHQLLSISPPPPIPVSVAQGTQDSSITSSGPKGVGGWLVFFCVGLTILGPLLTLNQMVTGWTETAPAFEKYPVIKTALLCENIGLLALTVYGFVVGCLIWSGNLKGRTMARRFLLIRLLGFIAVELAALFVMRDLPREMLAAGAGGVFGAILQTGIYFLVWWFYFKKSKRVRNTYGDESA